MIFGRIWRPGKATWRPAISSTVCYGRRRRGYGNDPCPSMCVHPSFRPSEILFPKLLSTSFELIRNFADFSYDMKMCILFLVMFSQCI